MGKRMTLRGAFWRFLCLLLVGLSLAVLLPFVVLTGCVNAGMATTANYSEAGAKEIAPILAAAPDLSKVQLPMGIQYVVLDLEYEILGANLEGEDLERAIHYATTGKSDASSKKQYLLVSRKDENVVLQYHIGSQFTNEWMREHLPTPEALFVGWIALNAVLVCMVLTARFAKRLSKQLEPIFAATEEIAAQNLDFDVGHSKVKEFDEVLVSFADMKNNLKESLEKQWRAEAQQKEQIAALAHDLKTPLTIIQGNADLLGETALNEEQRIYKDYISHSSEQMELYIKTLIEISKAAMGYRLCMEEIEVLSFLKRLEEQVTALGRTKRIRLRMHEFDLPDYIKADRQLLERAIMNVVNNALDYSPEEGIIDINVAMNWHYLQITVTDRGQGFSEEALLHARERFYMEDLSRSSKLHFGMGLYIAETVVKQHGGELLLENSEVGGARVAIRIPVKKDTDGGEFDEITSL